MAHVNEVVYVGNIKFEQNNFRAKIYKMSLKSRRAGANYP